MFSVGFEMSLAKVVGDTIVKWGAETSIAGLNNIVHRKSYLKKAYWGILFLLGCWQTIDGIVSVFVNYYDFNVTTSIDLSNNPSVPFPAVTICNLNRVHCTNVFEEKVYYHDLVFAMKENNTDESRIQSFAETLEGLNELFESTGCKDQTCSTLEMFVPKSNSDIQSMTIGSFNGLKARRTIECSGPSTFVYECYTWYLIKDGKIEALNVDEDVALEAIESLKCEESPQELIQSFCNPKWLEDFSKPKPGTAPSGPPIDAVRPSVCDELPNPQTETGGPNQPIDDGSQGQTKSEFEKEAEFLKSYMNFEGHVLAKIGHRADTSYSSLFQQNITGFIASCTYKGKPCNDPAFWFPFGMPQYGNCFTFNSAYNVDRDPSPGRDATLTGSLYGLSVEVFLDQDNYMLKKLSKKAGARIVIHDPRLPPLPDENGLDLSPNTATSMAVQTNLITRLPHPYDSNCTKYWNETKYDINDTSSIFTLAGCERYCLQQSIAELCDCFHPLLVQTTINSTFNREPCLITPSNDNLDYLCFDDVMKAYDNLSRTCDCRVACDEINYSGIISTSTWPSNQYWYELANNLGYNINKDETKGPAALETKARIQQNYARVDVYFQTLNVKSIIQSPLYPATSMISLLGGALSLYLGIALIMAFEIVELLWDIMVNIFHHCSRSSKKSRK